MRADTPTRRISRASCARSWAVERDGIASQRVRLRRPDRARRHHRAHLRLQSDLERGAHTRDRAECAGAGDVDVPGPGGGLLMHDLVALRLEVRGQVVRHRLEIGDVRPEAALALEHSHVDS